MGADNIFSGLKVVDLASFIAGPSAAVILGDFGADVVKVEPPTGDPWRMGYKIPPQPRAHDNYPWHLNNRNKRGLALDLKSPAAGEVLERLVKWADVLIVNTPHPARKKLKLEYDAGAPPTFPVTGSGDHATAVGLFAAIATALYRRERTGRGSYVTTSLIAEGVWSCGVSVQAALCDATFFPLHDRQNPPNAAMNLYLTADDSWLMLVMLPAKWPAFVKVVGRDDLASDARFADPV